MRIRNITTYAPNNKIYFTAVKNKKALPLFVIKHYGLNMETMVGYTGKKNIEPMPLDMDERLSRISRKLEINWATHIKKAKQVIPSL